MPNSRLSLQSRIVVTCLLLFSMTSVVVPTLVLVNTKVAMVSSETARLSIMSHQEITPQPVSADNHQYQFQPSLLSSPSPPPPAAHDALWNHTYGGTGADHGQGLAACSDGGYALVGYTDSFGAGGLDVWLVRTDSNGNHLWNHTYGGTGTDASWAVVECSGGGFAIAGWTTSYGSGGNDVWLVRTDSDGNHLWNHTYGSTGNDRCLDVVECSGGGFAIAGTTSSWGAGGDDMWLIRTNANGSPLWNRTYGDISNDGGHALVECSGGSGGFALAGYLDGMGYGMINMWLVRTDATGNVLWDREYDYSDEDDYAYAVMECSNGDFVIAGHGLDDFTYRRNVWIICTNLNGGYRWGRLYDGGGHDDGFSVAESEEGNVIVTGRTSSYGAGSYDSWVIIHDSNGQYLWNQTYGGSGSEGGFESVWITQGGLVFAGITSSWGTGSDDFWLVQVPLPYWVEVPSDQFQEVGETFQYDVNASSTAGIDQWWLNDTAHFTIDTNGIITNAIFLPVENYSLEVWVNDTLDNQLTAIFTITVVDTLPPTWREVPSDQVLDYGMGFRYDLNATDPSGLATWWLNYTPVFMIDSHGVIINKLALVVGEYNLQIWVNDTFGHILTSTFTLTVHDTTAPAWVIAPTDQTLEPGEALDYQVPATDPSGISHWTLNDTVHFALSPTYYVGGSTARLTNATTLTPGTYGLAITVVDIYGNPRSAAFTVTLQAPPAQPVPRFPLEVLGLGAAIAIAPAIAVGFIVGHRRKKS